MLWGEKSGGVPAHPREGFRPTPGTEPRALRRHGKRPTRQGVSAARTLPRAPRGPGKGVSA